MIDRQLVPVVVGALVALVVATGVVLALERRADTERMRSSVANVKARIVAWWWMIGIMLGALALGRAGVVGFFALVSFLALREIVALVPTLRGDHATLIGAFLVAIPVQYGLVWTDDRSGLFAVFIPVFALLALSVRIAVTGATQRFMHRVAALQYALMIGVYCISHAPALLNLSIPGYEGQQWKLLVFLVTVVQAGDVLQFLWGKALGRTLLAPTLSPSKTVEGLVGGVLSVTALGAALTYLTPFSLAGSTGLAFACAVAGACGGAVMSAIKRDAGVKDYGDLLGAHGGMLDRVDSLAFAAPLFFHLVRWLHSTV